MFLFIICFSRMSGGGQAGAAAAADVCWWGWIQGFHFEAKMDACAHFFLLPLHVAFSRSLYNADDHQLPVPWQRKEQYASNLQRGHA